jgi:TRAP-type C4-dicarboxylate transport system permease small subunit
MQKARDFLELVIKWIERLAVVFLVAMVLLVFANAVCRYLFDYGLNQVEELSRFAFVWMSFLGTAVAYHRKEHITIPFLRDRLRGNSQKAVDALAQLIITATFIVFLYSAWLYTANTLLVKAHGTGIYLGFVSVAAFVMPLCVLLVDAINLLTFFRRGSANRGREG